MKFSSNSTELQHTLSKLGGVIPSKSTMPILENILFDLSGGLLTMTATDLMLSLTVTQPVDGREDGKIAIPAKRLMDTMRSLPDTTASFVIDTTTNKIRIHTETGQYLLTGEIAKDYPTIPPFKATEKLELDMEILRKIIYRTVFAVSTDELRPAMMGVLFQTKGSEFRAVSTDGHRLVKLCYASDQMTALKKDIIIPAKALQVVAKSLEEGETSVSISETHIRFSVGNSALVSRLIGETYPNYESVIPSDNTKMVAVNRESIISSIRRVALYASATTHQVRFEIGKDYLVISAQDLDFGGEAKETIPCSYGGESLEIGFNAIYLVDILSHIETDQVELRFSLPTRAGIIAPLGGSKGEEVVMLVMPVRLNS